ncbi:MAG: hypothetical protein LBE62_14150 [Azonexus sp.]|jgi:hypothetical protein|nr:hypothetical protein [Azonexus sp.]
MLDGQAAHTEKVEKSTTTELKNAISRISDDSHDPDPDQMQQDILTVTEEIYNLLANGKSEDEIASHLSSLGLSPDDFGPIFKFASLNASVLKKLGVNESIVDLVRSQIKIEKNFKKYIAPYIIHFIVFILILVIVAVFLFY